MARERGDVRGDGRADFYWLTMGGAGAHSAIMEWNGSSFVWTYTGYAASPWLGFIDADFSNDADAAADIMYVNLNTRAIGFRNYDASLNATWQGLGTYGPGYDVWDIGDFTNDGTDDILFFQRDNFEASQPAKIGFWDIDNGVVTRWVDLGTVSAGWQPSISADFNNDGTTDIFWYNETTGDTGLWNFNTSGGYAWQGLQTVAPSSGWTFWTGGDVTGDGRIDPLWTKIGATGIDIGLWDLSGGQPVWRYLGQAPSGWQFINAADFTGDGTADIVLQDADGHFGLWDYGAGATYERWVYVGRDVPGDEWQLFY